MDRHGHVLVVGGTGMLAQATQALAARCDVLTLVARTERSLRSLDDALATSGVTRHLLRLDWSDPRAFVGTLEEHVDRVGAPALVVAWLHDDTLGPAVARAVARDPGCDFLQVRGSSAASPSADTGAIARDPRIPAQARYRQVILGFVVTEGRSRWLSHHEISEGTLQAVDHPQAVTVVGTVEPWDRRP